MLTYLGGVFCSGGGHVILGTYLLLTKYNKGTRIIQDTVTLNSVQGLKYLVSETSSERQSTFNRIKDASILIYFYRSPS